VIRMTATGDGGRDGTQITQKEGINTDFGFLLIASYDWFRFPKSTF